MDLEIRREDDCWTVTLDRPAVANALSAALVESLIQTVEEARHACVAVLAFKGQGRNFSAGFDFGSLDSQSEGDLLQRFVRIEQLLQLIARSPCLTVGFSHGRNFGAGVDLFAACRWRIASETTAFRMPGLAFGIVLGTRRFASIVGADKAREILQNLKTFTAPQGESLGFVHRIAPAEEWSSIIQEARTAASTLPVASRLRLYETLLADHADADLADLVRSAAEPGLKQRIHDYLAAQERWRSHNQ
jgi:enoyl-CoA hydratase/carnithine racemase